MSKILPWMPKRHRGTRQTYIIRKGRQYGLSQRRNRQSSGAAETDDADWKYCEAVTRPFAAGFEFQGIDLSSADPDGRMNKQ
jgi:hypothetical protein